MASTVPTPVSSSAPTSVATLADRIDALLPQTQCTRCGFAACRPYADAIAAGATGINRCPPGGAELIAALAVLTGRAALPLAPECGEAGPREVAVIDEATCIGCALCIAACPVDAILGAQKRMHTVLTSLCTGCALCLPPCPVDCITLHPAASAWTTADAIAARDRHRRRAARLARGERVAKRLQSNANATPSPSAGMHDQARRQAAVAAALARARARRANGARGKP